ncbi:MAG: flagellar basal body-associated FliL family protein [Devosiaceae bacterium]|nr:flagellar basal body-associated FliL family protein [Devosiaceae bacterium MH13]
MANTDTADEQAPAEEAAAEAPEEGAKGGFKLSKKMLMIAGGVGVLTLIGGGAGAAYLLGWFGGDTAEDVALEQVQAPVFYYDLPEITVNLANAEQRAQYLRILVALEMADPEVQTIIEPNLPRILDVFQTYLRELRISDLEGSAGLFRLKHELSRRINLAIYPAEIDAVLFRELIVQ